MLISRLVLRNFKRYLDQEICFRDGITGIVGNNGAGKSTIVDAILFALYGVQGTGLDPAYLVSSSAGQKEWCEVRLDFSVDGREYTIFRKFRKLSGPAQHDARINIQHGDERRLLATGVSEVAREVRRIIGMGPADFRSTVFAGQKDLLSLLDKTAGKRKEWYLRVLGIQYLKEETTSELKRRLDQCDQDRIRLAGRIENRSPETIRAALDTALTNHEATMAEASRLKSRLAALADQGRAAEREVERIQTMRDAWIRLQEQERAARADLAREELERARIDAMLAELESLAPDLLSMAEAEERYEEIAERYRRSVDLKREHADLTVRREYAERTAADFDSRIGQKEEALRNLDADAATVAALAAVVGRRDAVRARIEVVRHLEQQRDGHIAAERNANARFTAIESRLASLGREILVLEAKARELEELEPVVCGHDAIAEDHRRLEDVRLHADRIGILRGQCEKGRVEIERLRERSKEIEGFLAGSESLRTRIRELEVRLEHLADEAGRAEAHQTSLSREIDRIDARTAELKAVGRGAPCPTCHRPLRDHYEGLMAELASERAALCTSEEDGKRAVLALQQQRRDSAAALGRARADGETIQALEKERAVITAGIATRTAEIEGWEVEVSAEEEAIRASGLPGYDAGRHATLTRLLQTLAPLVSRVRELRIACAALPPRRDEWERLDAEAQRSLADGILAREQAKKTGFDAAEKKQLMEEDTRIEDAVRQLERARERCETRARTEQELRDLRDGQARSAAEADALQRAIQALGFDEAQHTATSEEWQRAEEMHRRYQKTAASVAQLPDLRRSRDERAGAIERRMKDLGLLAEEIRKNGFDEEALAAARHLLARITGETSEVQGAAGECRSRLQAIEEQRHALKADLAAAEKDRAEIEQLQGEMEQLGLTQSILNRFIVHLLAVVRGRIEGTASEVLAEITDGKYGQVMVDEDFGVLVNDLGGDYPSDRFSGGEQDDIAVALRIALSRYLAEIHQIHDASFLIFDEIFGSQDEERRSNLIRALRTQEAHFPQIFLISHVGEVHDEFTTTLAVEMGPDGTSRVEEEQRA